jgi:predicted anti-sigma-YlaC factor YlaD
MSHLMRDELIQWRDHGRAEDRDRVVSHLATCASCAGMYAELIRTAPAVQESTRFDPKDFVKRGYAVRREAAARAWPSFATSWKTWAGAFSAAVVLLIVVLVGPRQQFTTLSGSGGGATGARLTVMFQPDVTEDAMRQTLLEIEGSIVSGPSALGVYVIQLPTQADNDRAVQAVIDRLRSSTSVIRFVEREP